MLPELVFGGGRGLKGCGAQVGRVTCGGAVADGDRRGHTHTIHACGDIHDCGVRRGHTHTRGEIR